MALSRIWTAFFLLAFVTVTYQWLADGSGVVFQTLSKAMLDAAKTAVEISLGLVGVMAFWLGIMRVGEKAGLINTVSRLLAPALSRLFPEVPAGHPALGAIIMNFSANVLGLDSAATPLGLEAMRQLQTLNPTPERASNAQLMFTIINTAGLTLIPVSVMVFRAQAGAANPADIFLPAMIGTVISALAGVLLTAVLQKLNLLAPALILPFIGVVIGLGIVLYLATQLPQAALSYYSLVGGNMLIVLVVVGFIGTGAIKGLNVYDEFVEGAKEGFTTGVRIIPFLVAMLCAIAAIRASGVLDLLISTIQHIVAVLEMDTAFVPALPTALMKPLSGSGARGLMLDTMKTYGPDSFVGRTVCTVQGGTETTFYVLALYYGSVGVKNTRYSLAVGLVVDLIGVIAAIALSYLFFSQA